MNDSPKEMRKQICEQGITLSLMEAELLASKEEITKLKEESDKWKDCYESHHRSLRQQMNETRGVWKKLREIKARAIQAEQERELWENRAENAKKDRDTFVREMHEYRHRARKAEQERDRVQSTLMEVEKAKLLAHNQWWQMREERNALLEGLKWYADKERYKLTVHIRNYRQYESIVQTDEGSHARSIIAKLEGSKPDDAR